MLKIYKITINTWSTYIVAHVKEQDAKALALASHRDLSGWEEDHGDCEEITIEEITPQEPGVIHEWMR